jgi:CBS domain-containing protein
MKGIQMSKISHVLLKNPVVIPTGTKLIEITKLMKKNKIGSVLVSRNNKLAGIVSVVDIAYSASSGKRDISVDEIMHSPELTIESNKWITDALELFRCHNVSHLAVVENGEKVGIIRAEDILHTYRFNIEHHNIALEKNDENPFLAA